MSWFLIKYHGFRIGVMAATLGAYFAVVALFFWGFDFLAGKYGVTFVVKWLLAMWIFGRAWEFLSELALEFWRETRVPDRWREKRREE